MAAAAAPAPARTVGRRYRLVERIGAGGMGEVWRADDTLLGRPVAVKALRPERAADPEFLARFRAEARWAGRLHHPGVASVLDYGEDDGAPWLVLELVEGEALSGLLRREGRLSAARTVDVVAQAAAALQAAHAGGLVHRDVKPGNLLVRPDGAVKVTDFGVATTAERGDGDPLTRTGTLLGTVGYLSPEQAAGSPATAASDLYALGVVAYECLAGHRPFAGDNPVSVALQHLRDAPPPLPADVPADVAALVLRTLAKDPADRPATAGELGREAAALRDRLGDLPAPVVVPPAGAHADDPATRALSVVDPYPAGSGPATRVVASPLGHRPASPRRRRARWLVPALTALLGLVGVAVAASSSGPREVLVPAVAGVPVDQAAAALGRLGLEVQRRDEPSGDVDRGIVLRSDPGAEAAVEPGAVVLLVVSSGPPPVLVDAAALVGRPEGEAVATLAAAGLVPVVRTDGTGGPPGTVTAVAPAGEVPAGSTVAVSVVPPPPPPAPAAVAPAPAPAPAADRGPDRDRGPGKGKGKGKK